MNNQITFKISMPSDNGFVGRECKNPKCKRYFKIHFSSLKNNMFCPYCGILFDKSELVTKDQLDYVREAGKEKMHAYVHKQLKDMLTKAIRGNKYVTFKLGNDYMPKPILPKYIEKKVDSEIECSQCKAVFQIYGIFGYCPACKCDNAIIYDTNIGIILKEIGNSNDKKRALWHAYNDLVSTFEVFCKNKNVNGKKCNFQNLESAKLFFHTELNIDIFQKLSLDQVLSIRRVFQKRHAYQHNDGTIDQRYIMLIPEDSHLLNTKAILTKEEFIEGTEIMRIILNKII